MTVHYRTQGFIFKKIDFGEADRFYTIFTKDFGRLEIFGKGIRKIKAKLRGPLELFNLSELEFIQGRRYKTLTDALLVESFQGIKKDLNKLEIAFEISVIFDKLLRGEERDEKIWHLVLEVFRSLDTNNLPARQPVRFESRSESGESSSLQAMAGGQSITHKLIYYYFLWNLLSFLGHRPKIQKCLVCQKKINESKIFWSSLEGGVICLRCSKEIQEKRVINLNTAKLLKLIFQRNWQILRRLKISPRDLEDLETLSQDYLIALGFQ